MLSKLGKSWDDVANTNVSLEAIDPKAIKYFLTMAIDAGRLSPSAKADDIETWGRGIEKICEEFKKASMEMPTFEQTQGGVLVTFKRKSSANEQKGEQKDEQKKQTDRQSLILSVLQENPSIAQKEMSERTGIPYITLRREMDILRQEGYITRQGSKTYGHWVVNIDNINED